MPLNLELFSLVPVAKPAGWAWDTVWLGGPELSLAPASPLSPHPSPCSRSGDSPLAPSSTSLCCAPHPTHCRDDRAAPLPGRRPRPLPPQLGHGLAPTFISRGPPPMSRPSPLDSGRGSADPERLRSGQGAASRRSEQQFGVRASSVEAVCCQLLSRCQNPRWTQCCAENPSETSSDALRGLLLPGHRRQKSLAHRECMRERLPSKPRRCRG